MLTSIQGPKKEGAPQEDAVALLLGCHQRIRHFTAMSARLAAAPDAPAADVRSAAAAILRYFEVGLPLHEADENESIHPRLHAALPAGALAAANDAMVAQHAAINDAVRRLKPLWQELERAPETLPARAAELARLTAELQSLWEVHLALEEEEIVPAMRRHLSPGQLDQVREEMRARRQG